MCGERKICREVVVISLKLVSCNAMLLYVCMNRLKIILVNMITGNISHSIHDKDNNVKVHTYFPGRTWFHISYGKRTPSSELSSSPSFTSPSTSFCSHSRSSSLKVGLICGL